MEMVEVKRVKDATGAYCLECNYVFIDCTFWHWRKSQWMHEKGTGHKTILFIWKEQKNKTGVKNES